MNKENKCCICGRVFEGYGNNAEPVAVGQCCDQCNMSVVIPARIEASMTGEIPEAYMYNKPE